MATWYSTEHPLLNRPEDRPVAARSDDGNLKLAHWSYTMTGDEAENETLVLGKLPAGSMIMKDGSFVVATGTIASTCTIDVGDNDGSGSVDRYASNLNVAAAGTDVFSAQPLYELTEEASIIVTFDTLSTPGTGVLDFYIVYRQG